MFSWNKMVSAITLVSCCVSQPGVATETATGSFTYVCQEAGAGGYQAFPDVCRLQDGRLMCVFYAGYHHISLPCPQFPKGGRISYCTSRDEGHSWSKAKVLYDSPEDDRDSSIIQLKNGQIICNFFMIHRTADARQPCPDPYEEPRTTLGTWIVASDDLGKTWTTPRQVYGDYTTSSPIRELSDGRLILPLYGRTERGVYRAATGHCAVGISDDGGKIWSKPIVINNGGRPPLSENDVIELADRTLYAVERGAVTNSAMCYSVSKDRGKIWSISKPIGFQGHSPYLHRTRDGIIILAYRLHSAASTCLRYSLDECKTWSDNIVVDKVMGAYPSMVNLKDGSVLIVYYEEISGSAIRAKRFRVAKTGIQWFAP
jgi:hypothetical protein